MDNERIAEAPKARHPKKRGSVPRRQPRPLTDAEKEKRANKRDARQQQKQPSDLCASLALGVVDIIPGAVREVVRWRCPKDLRITFTSLVVDILDPDATVEAKLYHNQEYLGSIPVSAGSNSAFLAFKEIIFKQFDLVRVELSIQPENLAIKMTSDPGPAGEVSVITAPPPVTIGPMDFILRFK